jgi:hypothetical protein
MAPVAAHDMCQLVGEDDLHLIGRPRPGGVRQDDDRSPRAPRRQQRRVGAMKQSHRCGQPKGAAQRVALRAPDATVDRCRGTGDGSQADEGGDQPAGCPSDAHQPHPRQHRDRVRGPRRRRQRHFEGGGDPVDARQRRRGRLDRCRGRCRPRRQLHGDDVGHRDPQRRRRQRGSDGNGEQPMPLGGRSPAEQRGGQRGPTKEHCHHQGVQRQHRDHRRPSRLALATSLAMRSSSASVSAAPSPPSSAPTTFSTEPS